MTSLLLERTVRRRPFATWLCAAVGSTLGDSVTFFALGWMAAGFGPHAASLLLTVESVPLCLLILVGGDLADRWGVRRVMVACDAAMLAVMVAFAAGSLSGVPFWSLLVVALASGTASALRRPAAGVFPRLFATEEDLARRLATTNASVQVARIAGPTLGGFLMAFGGVSATAALDALSFGIVLVVLVAVRPPGEPERPGPEADRAWSGILAGARAARRTPGVPTMLLTVVGLAVTVLPLVMLCVPLAGRERGWSAAETGAVSAAWLAGTLAVTLVVARRGAAGPRAVALGPVLGAAAVTLLAATRSPVVAMVAQATVGAGTALLTTRLLPTFVASTPPAMLARFQWLLGLAQTGPVLVATPVLGMVAGRGGVRAALGLVALVLALTAVAAARATRQDAPRQDAPREDAPRPPE